MDTASAHTPLSSTSRRGDRVQTPGGGIGRFVGAGRHGTWIAYEGDDFDAMCATFDALNGVRLDVVAVRDADLDDDTGEPRAA